LTAIKTALVVGGTDGVGLSIVNALVAANYNVYFIGRNPKKGRCLEAELRKRTDAEIVFIALDLSSTSSVMEWIAEFSEAHSSLDLLVHVAGVILDKREETREGIEKTFAVGYLSAYLLATELCPLLEQSTNPRILFVSGIERIALNSKLAGDNVNLTEKYSGFRAAESTIHAKTVLAEVLSEEFLNKGINVNAFHPGMVKSSLGRDMRWPLNHIYKLASYFMARASKAGIRGCLSETLNNTTGCYLYGEKLKQLAFDAQSKKDLSRMTKALVGHLVTR